MKGICFKEPLFNAIIYGRKTMIRRIINGTLTIGNWEETIKHARYKTDEIIYLKEPYLIPVNIFGQEFEDRGIEYVYGEGALPESGFVRKNKLFMPEGFARYFIQITDVKLERLQEISHDDCIREGITEEWDFETPGYSNRLNYSKRKNGFLDIYHETPQKAFADLIDKISGKGVFDKNPYCWVYTFKLIK